MDAKGNPNCRTVLMTADTVGGVWTYAMDLSRALGGYGTNVVLATMGQRMSSVQRAQAAGIRNLRVFESEYELEWMPEPWADVQRAGDWLRGIAEQVHPDVIHLNGYVHAALPWNAPVIVMAHSCVLSWWHAVKGGNAPAEYDRYRREVAKGLRAADIVVAPTRGMLACIERHYGRPTDARVIPNGRDAARYRVGRKEPFVLAAGRLWDEAKNISALQSIARALPWPVCVAGDDVHPGGVRRPFADMCCLGVLSEDDLASWFARAAIYALPARYEPFGLSVLEAALSGCALVLGDIPTLRESWSAAALFVDPNDGKMLLAAIKALIHNEPLRTTLAARARERALKMDAVRMARDWADTYADAAALKEMKTCA